MRLLRRTKSATGNCSARASGRTPAASIVAAFACSTLIGVAFGFLPARNAAQLDPVEALARE